MSATLTVQADRGKYDVRIETGVLEQISALVSDLTDARQCLVVADAQVADTHARVVVDALRQAQWTVSTMALTARESLKRIDAVVDIWSAALEARLDRRSVIFAVGGGLVGDVAGFAAATYLRGIDVVHVPTTLLAMADASVGGKTGINLELPGVGTGGGRLGKNLAGAFWPPRLVLADPATLETLDSRDYRCGLAECAKHAMLGDAQLAGLLDDHAPAILARDLSVVESVIERAVAVKAGVVAADERESGTRMHLNLGHTFAHAIEPIEELDLRHGEAVSIGLCAASACSQAMNLIEQGRVDATRARLERLGLPVMVPRPVPLEHLLDAMRFDKKVLGGALRLVLPVDEGAVVRDDVPGEAIAHAWSAVMPDQGLE